MTKWQNLCTVIADESSNHRRLDLETLEYYIRDLGSPIQ